METSNIIVGVYDTHDAAMVALEALKASGLPVKNMSFISKADVIENKLHASIGNDLSNLPIEIGVVLGPILGILAGLSIVAVPGFGIFYGAGAMVGAMAGFDFGLLGGGISTLFLKLGMKDKALVYQEYLEKGKYIITISGDKELAKKAKVILHTVDLHIDLQHHQ